ncbi:MAG TPA: hypothetical protein VJO72_02350 [Candidatus Dormibacteraeota bacterium]|nr:hypothetical protein [Candidatus Dormibacteraeota bacterium]
MDPDWPFIGAVNWRHGVTLTAADTSKLLHDLECSLSVPLDTTVLESAPQVFHVWFEPKPATLPDGTVAAPTVLRVLDGRAKMSPVIVVWGTTHTDASLTELLSTGGRILVRVQCPNLYDAKRRPFSATLAGVLKLAGPHPPGGVLESWWFVKG